ncbi:hypothetical protein CWR43_23650 [Rhizobium sullae]|uniref:Uncharacterized protein n=1 Tax=Rhizobium sullae TaxID=50338 RepID=A0A2N0D562_RHISU|nr:hypothetical protein CWR43_23650 [Rhizobium sullae]
MGTGRSRGEATTAAQWIKNGNFRKFCAQEREIATLGITAGRRVSIRIFMSALPSWRLKMCTNNAKIAKFPVQNRRKLNNSGPRCVLLHRNHS